jgi:hypothetical protein
MGEVLEQENLRKALGRVRRNKGAPGIDGLTSQPPFGVLSELMPAATGRADLITSCVRQVQQKDLRYVGPSKAVGAERSP